VQEIRKSTSDASIDIDIGDAGREGDLVWNSQSVLTKSPGWLAW